MLALTGPGLAICGGRCHTKNVCHLTATVQRPHLVSLSEQRQPFQRQQRRSLSRCARLAVVTRSLPSSLSTPCSAATHAVQFYHLSETNEFKTFASIVTPDVAWRQRGLLQGKQTHIGAEAVYEALVDLHAAYQDLTFNVNNYAEEEGRVALFWTAHGTNRVGLFGMEPTFKRSTFSGVSLVSLAPDGRIREVIEYRQPTHEEMAAHLNRDLPDPQRAAVERLLLRGHATPRAAAAAASAAASASVAGAGGGKSASYCQLPATREIDPMWRVRAVQAATEWVENWTPGPDLEKLVRDDIEEYNVYSWPDFEQDVIGLDALEERRSRSSQDAVVIRSTTADSTTNIVAVHWFDFEQQHLEAAAAATAATAKQPCGACSGSSTAAASGAGAAPPQDVPRNALPRQQPTLHPEHGSVEVKNGHLRLHLPSAVGRRSTGSEDEADGDLAGITRLHKFRGVTLFRLDEDCRLAWLVTFRELKATELDTYLSKKKPAVAAAGLGAQR